VEHNAGSSFDQPEQDRAMTAETRPSGNRILKWVPLIALMVALGVIFALGWHTALIRTIGLNLEPIKAFVAGHRVTAIAVFTLIYAAAVVLVPPAGAVLTIGGGLVFGALYSGPATVIGATMGATVLFLIVRTSLGQAIAARAGDWVNRLREGFADNAFSYMLFLRLVPVFPFFVVNVVPGLLGVPLRTFVLGTLIGIIPGTAAYALLGEGAGSIFAKANADYAQCTVQRPASACPYSLSFADLVTPELITAFVVLALVALVPVALSRIKKRSKAHAAI
jgi:uncharacterized membrane protein YdjX (TVP38/TMEM64 family)